MWKCGVSWAGIFLAMTFTARISFGQTVLVSPPAEPVMAGSPAEMAVFFLNTGNTPLPLAAPDALPGECRWSDGAADVTLTRVEPVADRELPAGGFVRAVYRFVIPDAARGQVTIALSGSPPAVIQVTNAATDSPPSTQLSASTVATTPRPRDPERNEVTDYVAKHFSAYEPMYFLIGSSDPRGKFQISLKYRIFNEDASIVQAAPLLGGLHFGYSQTSFWDLESVSSPFFDNSYRPELMVSYADLLPKSDGPLRHLGLQAGVQHESNGQDGLDSRSMNYVYVRPTFTFSAADDDLRSDSLFLSVSPRLHAYIGDDGDNPDIEEFRGYGDLRVVVGQHGGLQLAAVGRLGSDFDKGSLQLDLTYPLRPLLRDNLDIFLHGQFFTGFGESLLLYNESDTTFRVGVSLVR